MAKNQEKPAKKKIAFQGLFGAHSHAACTEFYPDHEATPVLSFVQVFAAVESGEADFGIIPLENSYAGRVAEIHNLLQDSNCYIVAEHFLKIEHHLAAKKGTKIDDISEIYSHPQALMQCRNNLIELSKQQKIMEIECSNTAKAAEIVTGRNDHDSGALCSKLAAKLNGLEIIQENMQDSGNANFTIFIVLAKKMIDPDPDQGRVITTMLFTARNIPGALYKIIGGFATNGVNLIKLESYIPSGKSDRAKFFVAIEGHPSQKEMTLALQEVGFFSKSIKLLGVYPADPQRGE